MFFFIIAIIPYSFDDKIFFFQIFQLFNSVLDFPYGDGWVKNVFFIKWNSFFTNLVGIDHFLGVCQIFSLIGELVGS